MNDLVPKQAGELAPAYIANTAQDEARAVAEVKAALTVARYNPRNPIEVINRIKNECGRYSLAKVAKYNYARGGTKISGPSIRLAEAIALQWGNLQCGWRVLSSNQDKSYIEAFAWDMETNVKVARVFDVPHIRYSREKGNTPLTDPRDIYEMQANQAARRLRACILAVIPGDVVEEAIEMCNKTIDSKFKNNKETILEMLTAFEKFDVTKKDIEVYIQRNITAIEAGQFIHLLEIHNSLRDGMSVKTDWFKPPKEDDESNNGASPLSGGMDNAKIEKKPAKVKSEPKPEREPEPEAEPIVEENDNEDSGETYNPETGEIDDTVEDNGVSEDLSPEETIALMDNFDEMVKFVNARIANQGDAVVKSIISAAYKRLLILTRTDKDLPSAHNNVNIFTWLIAHGAPMAVLQAAWTDLVRSPSYSQLPQARKSELYGRYQTAIKP